MRSLSTTRNSRPCSFVKWAAAATVAKSLQSCPTLCDPTDGSPPGSPVPGILQARTLEWVAISFSNAWRWKVKVKSLSRVRLLVTPWTPGSSIHGIFQARVLEWGAIASSVWSGLNICIFLISKMSNLLYFADIQRSPKTLIFHKRVFLSLCPNKLKNKISSHLHSFLYFPSVPSLFLCEIFCTISTQTHLL